MAKRKSVKRTVEYLPPPDDVIDNFARAVCKELAAQDAAFDESETVRELAGFLRIVCAVQAKHLNKRGADHGTDGAPT